MFEGSFKIFSMEETQVLAAKFASFIKPPLTILLEGDLGAGKTTFVRCVCEALQTIDTVKSPSYTVINRYETQQFPVYHMDCYRLSDAEELLELGVEDFLRKEVCFIEWPDTMRHLINDVHYHIRIETQDYRSRQFHFNYVKEL